MNWIKRIPESQGWVQGIGEWVVRQHTFMPRMIDLEVSRVCNLSCPACMRRADSSLAQKGKDVQFCTLDRFKEVLEEIPTIGTLNFMGDGEPLMNPCLNDIISYASDRGIYTVLTTNTTLVTYEDIQFWENHKVYRIHASVDAAHKKLYEEMRVGAEWEKTYKALKLIGESSIPLCLNVVLTKKNMQEMPEMVELCREVGAREVTFLMPICTYGDDRDVRPEDSQVTRGLFSLTAKLCKSLGIKWIFPLTLNPTFRRFNFPFIRPQISIEGDVWACCYSLGRGKVWYEGYSYEVPNYNMGNMFGDGFRKVWYGEGFKEIRQIYRESEERRGTVIPRQELLRRTQEIMENPNSKYDHCRVCLARWGMACS
jgi:MoaA/NifB/PqqE/SkfB family radical SAM enzyme